MKPPWAEASKAHVIISMSYVMSQLMLGEEPPDGLICDLRSQRTAQQQHYQASITAFPGGVQIFYNTDT
jgi:hypothetical protein